MIRIWEHPEDRTEFCKNCKYYTDTEEWCGNVYSPYYGEVNPRGWCDDWMLDKRKKGRY